MGTLAGTTALNTGSSLLNHCAPIFAIGPNVTPPPRRLPPTGRMRPMVSPTSTSWSWTGRQAPASGLEAARLVSRSEPNIAARMKTVPPRR